MATPTNPLLDQLRQNVAETEARLKQEQEATLQQQKSLQSMISTPVEGYDDAIQRNPLQAAVHGRAARVSAAETGDLQTFNQFFRERVSSRDILADMFTGIGASMLGQRTLSLRDQKFQEYQLEQQAQVRRQQAEALNQKALQESFQTQVKALQGELKESRAQTSKDKVLLGQQQAALAKEEQAVKTKEEEAASKVIEETQGFQKEFLESLSNEDAQAMGWDMVLDDRQNGGTGILNAEQRDLLRETNQALTEKEADVARRQRQAGVTPLDLDAMADQAEETSLTAVMRGGVNEKRRPSLMRHILDKGRLVPKFDSTRTDMDKSLNIVENNRLMTGLYVEALAVARNEQWKSIDDIPANELEGFKSRLNGLVAQFQQGVLSENAAVAGLEALGYANGRQLLQSQGEDRFAENDMKQALKQVVKISNSPLEVKALTNITTREAVRAAFQIGRSEYTVGPIKRTWTWEEVAQDLLVQDGETMREKMERLLQAGVGVTF